MKKLVKRAVVTVSIGLLLISLTQQCYCTTSHCGDSLAAYFAGVLGFWHSWAGSTWLANPLMLISWLTINRSPKISLLTNLFAVILSFSFLLFNEIMDNEAGFYSQIISYLLGYWLWVASSVSMLIGNSFLYFWKPKQA